MGMRGSNLFVIFRESQLLISHKLSNMANIKNSTDVSRRGFIRKTAFACVGFPFFKPGLKSSFAADLVTNKKTMVQKLSNTSIIGAYGQWAASLLEDPSELSFRNTKWHALENWKPKAYKKVNDCIAQPSIQRSTEVVTHKAYTYDDLEIEEVSWQLSNGGGATEAYVLKPKGAKEPLPAILALHDHGGNKYFGKRKIVRTSEEHHPLIEEHQGQYYEGLAWANEIAKRGYVVMVHDTFVFGSRRILYNDVEGILWGHCHLNGKKDGFPENAKNIEAYNNWASEHEHILSKSLFCAGTTWPGVVLAEDRIALDVLCNRNDVDSKNVGCAGLSGGGLRTVYLGGLDERIKCAVSVGFMSTWKDFIMHKSFTHTWMLYAPLISRFLEFPEIMGLRAPLPTMVQNNEEDQLFTLSEMKKADVILQDVFKKANASENYVGKFYGGPHKFDAEMQSDAFDWFDRWLNR